MLPRLGQAWVTPKTARLSPSVPPLVKTIRMHGTPAGRLPTRARVRRRPASPVHDDGWTTRSEVLSEVGLHGLKDRGSTGVVGYCPDRRAHG